MSGSFFKNKESGIVVFVNVISYLGFHYSYAIKDKSLILSVISDLTDEHSKSKTGKNLFFNDSNEAVYIYDSHLDLGACFNSNLVEVQYSSDLDVAGEIIIIPLSGVMEGDETGDSESYSPYYWALKNYVGSSLNLSLGDKEGDCKFIYIRHKINNAKTMYDEISELNSYNLKKQNINIQGNMMTYLDGDGVVKVSIVNLMNELIANKNRKHNETVDDFLNLNFKIKSLGSSTACSIDNIFMN